MRIIGRDAEIVDALGVVGALTSRQIQTLAFPLENYTGCKRRLTKLIRAGALARYPRPYVNDCYVYCLPKSRPSKLLAHNLGISEVYVRVRRACKELGFTLAQWEGPSTLQPLLSARTKLAPDAYFRIQRQVEGETRTSGLFLEYEHRGSPSALVHKLTRYADLFYSGGYHELFGHRGMRVLVVYESELGMPSEVKLAKGLATARKLGVTLVRFITAEALTSCHPTELLTAPVWFRPDQDDAVALFIT